MRTLNLTLLLAGLLFCSGCTAIKSRLSQNSPLPAAAADPNSQANKAPNAASESLPAYQTPVKMLAIWKDSVRIEGNGDPMRGFGGRLYLYNADGAPVRAEGDLVVYGFDDSVINRQGSKADRKIVISNHQLQKQYSESALGPSYSVWITWDRVGSVDKNVTLVPFFRSSGGEIVQAGQAINPLHTPGKKSNSLYKEKISAFKQPPQTEVANRVSQVNYLEPSGNGRIENAGYENAGYEVPEHTQASMPSRSNLRTTTIAVPRATQQRLRSSNFGSASRDTVEKTLDIPIAEIETLTEKKPSRLEEARRKRKEQLKKGSVFGMPGQL